MSTPAKLATNRFPKITDEGLDDLRRRIGVPITDTVEPWNYEATRDAIRHYAHGIGDDNPLWSDPAYAEKTRYGALVALPSFLFSTSRIVSGYCGGLSGIHAMWAGAEWTWYKPTLRGDIISTQAYLKDLIEHKTRFAGRAFQQIYHVEFFNQAGDKLAACDSWVFRTDRDEARERGTKYTQARWAVSSRSRRNNLPSSTRCTKRKKFARKAKVLGRRAGRRDTPTHDERPDDGDRLHLLCAGLGWSLHPRQQARLEDQAKHPGLGIRNRFNVPDCPERVHWDEAFALEVGAPGAYGLRPGALLLVDAPHHQLDG